MRAAIELTEGVRNGQPIAALLGYQLERGLHERHPGIELDTIIYVLRDRFPLVSGLLADVPVGTSVETVEARNVVHGLDLLEATAEGTYPWGITGLPAVGTSAATAVAAEIDRIRDGLDAVADLLLCESVHQAVQGNFARTKASLQALTDPEAPPEPEVLRTPRSGRTLAFRVTIALDPSGGAGAPGTTPRANANRPLNHWLAQHLPALNTIGWTVRNGTAAPVTITVADVGVQPLDLVLMSGDRLGDRSSELERYIIRRFRFDAAVADDVTTIVVPEPATGDPAKIVELRFRNSRRGRHQPREASSPANTAARDRQPIAADACARRLAQHRDAAARRCRSDGLRLGRRGAGRLQGSCRSGRGRVQRVDARRHDAADRARRHRAAAHHAGERSDDRDRSGLAAGAADVAAGVVRCAPIRHRGGASGRRPLGLACPDRRADRSGQGCRQADHGSAGARAHAAQHDIPALAGERTRAVARACAASRRSCGGT